MIDDMTSSDDKLNSGSYFACLACHSKTPDQDQDEGPLGRERRQGFVRRQIEARRGNRNHLGERLSAGYVIEEAAKRHFELMAITTKSLREEGKFNDKDFRFLRDANPSPVWSVNCQFSLSGGILDEFGIEDVDDITDKDLRSLIKKLNSLTAVETLAVAEACELIWRGYQNPLL